MYSGMCKAAGLSVQVACTPAGRLAGGHTQDGQSTAEALRRSSLLDVPTSDLPDGGSPPQYIADKGYIGPEIIASKRIPAFTRSVLTTRSTKRPSDHVRYKIERVGANTQELAHPIGQLLKTTRHFPGIHHDSPRSYSNIPHE